MKTTSLAAELPAPLAKKIRKIARRKNMNAQALATLAVSLGLKHLMATLPPDPGKIVLFRR